jgi:DNA-binding HxlR family transcriptional regulator
MSPRSSSRVETVSAGPSRHVAVATVERPNPAATAEAAPCDGVPAECAEPSCCPRLHEAVELVGKRWTGAILAVMLQGGPMRFSQIAQAVPALSDRLLSERMKELEKRGMVERRVGGVSPARVEYELTPMGRDLAPALSELEAWAHRWLD